jgi:hypothetical protein
MSTVERWPDDAWARQVKRYSIYLDIANLNAEYQYEICEPEILYGAISDIAILSDQVKCLTRPSLNNNAYGT